MTLFKKMIPAFAMLVMLCLSSNAYADYPVVKIKNNTDYPIAGMVEYVSAFCSDDAYTVQPGKTWRAESRGVCLVDEINGRMYVEGDTIGMIYPHMGKKVKSKYGERTSIVAYKSSGTSYSKFQITAHGDQYRIFSEAEHKRVTKEAGMSPGFKLVNKTDWPIAYSMDQVGCLYYDVVPARWNGKDGVRVVDTGAVWFTMHYNIQPDGISPINEFEDCALPVIEITSAVLLGVAETVLTGSPKASGAIAAKVIAKQAVKEAIKISVKEIASQMASQLQNYMSETGSVTMYGQYAGYEWPFRCDKMPEYHITGGPKVLRDNEGGVYIQEGSPLKVVKVNTCGNDMMLASVKSATAGSDLPFPRMVDKKLNGIVDNGGSSGTPSSNPASGKLTNLVSGLGTCLSVVGTENNANVVSARCNGSDIKQKWKRSGKNIVHSSGKCLNVRKSDNNVTLWACNGDTNKVWVTSGTSLKNSGINKCLDVAGSNKRDGANVLAYQCTQNSNQKWTMKAASTSGSQASSGVVTLYEHCDYKGYSVSLPAGSYRLNSLRSKGAKNDDISSIKVDPGLQVQIFQHEGYQGTSKTLKNNAACLTTYNMNDDISSVRVTKR